MSAIKERGRDTHRTGYLTFAIALLLVAAIIRVYYAWLNRCCDNADFGVVALMAKHISEGKNFPAFFYGLAYGGSLEAAASALFCRLFGASGFTVSLGTALCSFPALIVSWRWARDIGGDRAGIAALSMLVVGSAYFAGYSVRSVGSYALTISLYSAVAWLSVRCVCRELEGRQLPWSAFAGLGLLAGIGWWTNQLILPSLAASAALFLLLGTGALSLRILGSGAAGFLLGSLPLWLWNFSNGWATFRLQNAFESRRLWSNLGDFFTLKIPEAMGWSEVSGFAGGAAYLLFLTAAAAFLALGLRGLLERRPSRWVGVLAILLLTGLHALLFSGSQFAREPSSRYLVPLVPLFAVVAGVAFGWLSERLHPLAAAVAVAFLVFLQFGTVKDFQENASRYGKRIKTVEALGEFLAGHEISSVYAPYRLYPLNFFLEERFTFSDVRGDRYGPYAVANELADHVAVMNDFGSLAAFLDYSGGSARKGKFRKPYESVHYDLRPPPHPMQEVAPEKIAAITDSTGRDARRALTDSNIATSWASSVPPTEVEHLEIVFTEPAVVDSFRMMSRLQFGYPEYWRLEGRTAGDDRWETLLENRGASFYYWSGPRPFWAGEFYRLEGHFAPRALSRLRIVRTHNGRRWPWEISELQIFSPAAEGAVSSEVEALPDLLNMLDERRIDRLYCDRWAADAVYRSCNGKVLTPLSRAVFGNEVPSLAPELTFTRGTALLVKAESAGICSRALRSADVAARAVPVGPWVLFDFASGQWRPEYRAITDLVWSGFGCLGGKPPEHRSDPLSGQGSAGP